MLILDYLLLFDELKIGAMSHEIEEVTMLCDLCYKINIMFIVEHFPGLDYVSVLAHSL